MCHTVMQHDFCVLSAPESVPLARRETAKILDGWGVPADVVGAARLIVTELLTNVVQHAALLSPTAAISLSHDGTCLTLTVSDSHPFRPRALQVPYGLGGRGLYLVRTLVDEAQGTHDVVADAGTGGKHVIISLPARVRAGGER
jgi:two-component sensor histidine kinase